MTAIRNQQQDADAAHYESWCDANRVSAWRLDTVDADNLLADYLYFHVQYRRVGHARLKDITSAVAAGYGRRKLSDPRGHQTSALRAAVRKRNGVTTEAKKIDPISSEEVRSIVVGAILERSAPSLTALRRSLALELGCEHEVPFGEMFVIRADALGEGCVILDSRRLNVATDLTRLREVQGAVLGTPSALRQSMKYLNNQLLTFEVRCEPFVGAGLTDEQLGWARFGANPAAVRALMWSALFLTGTEEAFRHNDLQRIVIESVVDRPDAIECYRYGSKTLGDDVALAAAVPHIHEIGRLCSACVLVGWYEWQHLVRGRTKGPLFVLQQGPRSGHGHPVSTQAARRVLKQAIAASPEANRRIGTRSIRIGTVTEMASAGASLEVIMGVTGQKTVSEAVRYLRMLSPGFQPHLDV